MTRKHSLNIAYIEPNISGKYDYLPNGFAYLNAYLKKFSEFDICGKLFRVRNNIDEVVNFQPDILALTSMTHSFLLSSEIARKLKAALPDIPILLGGPHITAAPYSLPETVDFGIAGEGEEVFNRFANAYFGNGDDINDSPSLIINKAGKCQANPRLPLIENIDDIPYPDRSIDSELEKIITTSNFGRFNRTGIRWMQLTTARGCPYNCKFCQPRVIWEKFRMHSAEYVAEEIDLIAGKYGINAIQVEDDLFTGNKTRLIKLIELLGKKNLLGKIIFNAAARAEQINEEWVEILKELGVVKIEFGFESGNNRMAKYWKGGKATKDINRNAVRLLNNAGIAVFGSFIAGAPDETENELLETRDFMFEITSMHKNNICSIGLATPLPGTELWNEAIAGGAIDRESPDWSRLSALAELPKDLSQVIYLNKHIPIEKTVDHIRQINRKMYLGTPVDFIKAIPRRAIKVIKRAGRRRN